MPEIVRCSPHWRSASAALELYGSTILHYCCVLANGLPPHHLVQPLPEKQAISVRRWSGLSIRRSSVSVQAAYVSRRPRCQGCRRLKVPLDGLPSLGIDALERSGQAGDNVAHPDHPNVLDAVVYARALEEQATERGPSPPPEAMLPGSQKAVKASIKEMPASLQRTLTTS